MGDWDVKKEAPNDWDVKEQTPISRYTEMFNLPAGASQPMDTMSLSPGKPMRMTTPDAAMSGAKHAGTMWPIVGDVGMSLAAPQKMGTDIGTKALNLMFRSGASGLGGAGGSMAGQMREKGDVDFNEVGEQAFWGAAGEGITSTAGALLKPVMKWASNLTVTGAGVKEWARKKMITRTTKRAAEFIQDTAPEVVSAKGPITDIGELALRVNEAVDEKNVAYQIFNKHIDSLAKGPEGGVILDDTQQLIGELRSKAGGDLDGYIEKIFGYSPKSKQSLFVKGILEDEVIDADNLKDILSNLYKSGKKSDWGSILPTQRKARDELKASILSDIERVSPLAKADKMEADKIFKEIAQFQKVQKVFKSNLRQMPSGDIYLNPTGLANTIEANKKILQDQSPELWKAMKAEADFYREMAKNWRPPSSKKDMLFGMLGGSAGTGLGSTGLALTGNAGWIPVFEGFGAFSAWMTLAPKTRKILGEVVKDTIIKPAAHTGGPMAFPIDFGALGSQ